MRFITLTAANNSNTELFILSVRFDKATKKDPKPAGVNYLLRVFANGVDSDYFLAFPTYTQNPKESEQEFLKFLGRCWGRKNVGKIRKIKQEGKPT
jgi:hypothetical protein